MTRLFLLLQNLGHLKPIFSWHHHIADDNIWDNLGGFFNPFFAINRFKNPVLRLKR